MTTPKWKRSCKGLYVNEQWKLVITDSGEGSTYWTIRKLEGWGLSTSGKLMPDYDGSWLGKYATYSEAKEAAGINWLDWELS
jgi:hypothetical protein